MRLRIQIASVIRYYLPACVTEYSNYTFHDFVAKALEIRYIEHSKQTRAHQTTEDEKLTQFHLIIFCKEEKNVPQKFKESYFYDVSCTRKNLYKVSSTPMVLCE